LSRSRSQSLAAAAAAGLAVIIGVALLATPSAASAAQTKWCHPTTFVCTFITDVPGTDPVSQPDPATGFTAGPTVCTWFDPVNIKNLIVPCVTDEGHWTNAKGCWNSPTEAQPGPPDEATDPNGAWYVCIAPDEACGIRDCFYVSYWSVDPPPGINTLTAAQAAQRLISTFQLEPVSIGFAPDPQIIGSKSYVGVPIWMWVDNPTPLSFGPYSQTATLGGTTITATAQVSSILWNMGDGSTVACANVGTPFMVAYGAVDSPTCGHRYTSTSDGQPAGRYTVTATSQWTVTWTGAGQTGSVPLSAATTTTVDINELQSVNVR